MSGSNLRGLSDCEVYPVRRVVARAGRDLPGRLNSPVAGRHRTRDGGASFRVGDENGEPAVARLRETTRRG